VRIGLVVTGGVDRSGRERVVPALLWLVERLARRHEVHVFVLRYERTPCDYPLLGATVHDLGRVDGPPGFRRFRMRRRLSAAVARHGPFDVLHAYWGMPAGAVAISVGRRRGVPTVVTFDSGELVALDDIEYGLQRRWHDRRAIAAVTRRAGRVTVATEHMARMRPLAGLHPSVVPMGIDVGAFPLAVRRDGPPWRLLRVASINGVKDYETLLRATAVLVERGSDVHLDIVGEDTLGGSMQRLAATLGLDARVTFHGFQPTDRLVAFYNRAHLHVVSSRHEAAGVVMLEAAGTGLPTVGTAVGYVADWSPDRAAAVPVGNPGALADAIAALLDDAPRRARMADAARAWALAHDADRTAGQFEILYRELRDAAITSPARPVRRSDTR
jgi:glycosyltransferase involved in cell wall biosynthesis